MTTVPHTGHGGTETRRSSSGSVFAVSPWLVVAAVLATLAPQGAAAQTGLTAAPQLTRVYDAIFDARFGAVPAYNARVEELSSLVMETEAISDSSAERSQEVAGIAEAQMSAVRRVAEAMVTLSSRIRELEQAVNRFQ